jgi:hypothetical protein
MSDSHALGQGNEEGGDWRSTARENEPLLAHPTSAASHTSLLPKQLTTRNAFSILVTLQIGSGIFASPAQVDSNVPSPGASLLVWVLGGLLSWAGAASFAELGAAIPLNGGMQEYLRYVYGDTMAFLMAWVYIMAAKPSSMAIQSIVIAESIGSISSFDSSVEAAFLLKLVAAVSFICIVVVNSISTRVTMKLSDSFTGLKIMTVFLVVLGGLVAIIAYQVNPRSALSGAEDWHTRNWFATRPTVSEGRTIDWPSMSTWESYGHYSAAIYGGLWAFDGWDNVSDNGNTKCFLFTRTLFLGVLTCKGKPCRKRNCKPRASAAKSYQSLHGCCTELLRTCEHRLLHFASLEWHKFKRCRSRQCRKIRIWQLGWCSHDSLSCLVVHRVDHWQRLHYRETNDSCLATCLSTSLPR